jgi:hypothetical protein
MSEINNKLFSVGTILGGFLFCLFLSFLVYTCSMFVIYGAWHCPHGNCYTPTWINIVILLLLTSPLLIFSIGAYLCRGAIYTLAKKRVLRIIMLSSFGLFPLYLLIGLIVYMVIANQK